MLSTAAADFWIIPTKVRVSPLPPDTIERPRPTARLLAGLSRPLTLVCAPAGFGKSTLLGTALAACPWPVVWLSLDAQDAVLPAFLHALVAAVREVFPAACRGTLSLLRLPE
jgi:LuxR family maltose regulon positive regulatory protein